jgi:hypothetical protein
VAYSRAEAKQRALAQANEVLYPLIAGGKRLSRIVEATATTRRKFVYVYSSGDLRIHILVLDLPASHPLVVAIYSSAQTSRPTSPSQLAKRVARLRREVNKLRHKVFESADIVYVYLSPRRLTRGSVYRALREGVLFSSSPTEVRRKLAKYLATRYRKLVERVAGSRIWGELPLLMYALNMLARRLTSSIEDDVAHILSTLHNAIKGLYTGAQLARILPQPP